MAGLGYKLRCLFGVALPGFAQRAFYLAKLRRWPHFRHPRDINEKIQWLKIHGDNRAIAPLADKWSAFGWDVVEMNGDEMEDIVRTLDAIDFKSTRPHLVISRTTKGKGVSFMENVAKWHHGVPTAEQYAQAIQEIEARIKEMEAAL